MRTALALVVASWLAIPGSPGRAAADVLESTLGEPLNEVSHAVDVSVSDG